MSSGEIVRILKVALEVQRRARSATTSVSGTIGARARTGVSGATLPSTARTRISTVSIRATNNKNKLWHLSATHVGPLILSFAPRFRKQFLPFRCARKPSWPKHPGRGTGLTATSPRREPRNDGVNHHRGPQRTAPVLGARSHVDRAPPRYNRFVPETEAPEFSLQRPLSSALAVLRAVLLSPRRFYLGFSPDGPLREPALFVLLVGAVTAVLTAAVAMVSNLFL